jgi:hypothetical protein
MRSQAMGGPLWVISRSMEAGDHLARDAHAHQHRPAGHDALHRLGIGRVHAHALQPIQFDITISGRLPIHRHHSHALRRQALGEGLQTDVDRLELLGKQICDFAHEEFSCPPNYQSPS